MNIYKDNLSVVKIYRFQYYPTQAGRKLFYVLIVSFISIKESMQYYLATQKQVNYYFVISADQKKEVGIGNRYYTLNFLRKIESANIDLLSFSSFLRDFRIIEGMPAKINPKISKTINIRLSPIWSIQRKVNKIINPFTVMIIALVSKWLSPFNWSKLW